MDGISTREAEEVGATGRIERTSWITENRSVDFRPGLPFHAKERSFLLTRQFREDSEESDITDRQTDDVYYLILTHCASSAFCTLGMLTSRQVTLSLTDTAAAVPAP